jgi:hypothetical protein
MPAFYKIGLVKGEFTHSRININSQLIFNFFKREVLFIKLIIELVLQALKYLAFFVSIVKIILFSIHW